MSPKKPTELKFAKLVEDMLKHYDPKPSVIVQHYQFNTQNHLMGETIASYIAKLRHLAEHCEFGTTLNATLQDRLVCGMEEPRIQRRLLVEPDLMFDKAFELWKQQTKMRKTCSPLSRRHCWSITSIIASRRCATAVGRITVWLIVVSKR